MIRLLAVLAVLLFVPSSAAASPPAPRTAAQQQPGVPPAFGAAPVLAPTELSFGAGGDLFVRKLRWTSPTHAVGTVYRNDCTPSCVDGTLHPYPADLQFSDVTPAKPRPYFNCVRLTYDDETSVIALSPRC